MRTASYIPAADPAFNDYALHFCAFAGANRAALGLGTDVPDILDAAIAAWTPAYTASIAPNTRTSVTIAAKDQQRASLTAVIRQYAQQVAINPSVDASLKTALGVNARNTLPRPKPTPVSNPVLSLDKASHLQHFLRYRDDAAPAGVRAKPAAAIALQLFGGVSATIPQDAATLPLIGSYTKVPMVVSQDPANVGKTMYYAARWTTRTGGVGPFCPIVPVVVI